MIVPSRVGFALAIAAAVLAAPGRARAQLRFHLDAEVARPLDRPQMDEYGLGAGGAFAVEWNPHPVVGLLARLQGLGFASYAGALPEGVQHPGSGTLEALSIGIRVHPVANMLGHGGEGIWLELSGGGGITGDAVRPLAAGRAGVSFGIGDFALGPFVSYTRVFDTGSEVLPGDAQLLLAGLELSYSILPPRPRREVPVPVAAAPAPAPNRCASNARVTFGDFDHDGCPDGDRDGDTIADVRDACPDAPEDFDGFEDPNGCPDLDNDHDGIPDVLDQCPNEPETVNGIDDDDGCPDHGPVAFAQGRIALSENIQFAFNSARILPESQRIIAAVAAVFRAHPEYGTVYVEGHADEIGAPLYNYNLSFQRARSVIDALVERGIVRARLVPLGFGRSSPIDRSNTPEARARNRRVEFVTHGHRSTGRARTDHGYMQIHDEEHAP